MFNKMTFDLIVEELLLVDYPIEIRFIFGKNSDIAAEHEPVYSAKGKLKKHIIRIWPDESETRSIDTLIAHELIHAWQAEREIDEIHGPEFQRKAEILENELFGLKNIYDPEIDGEDLFG